MVGSGATRVGWSRKQRLRIAEGDGDRRGVGNVLANGGVATLCALLVAGWVVRRRVRPLRGLIRAANQVASGNLDSAVPVGRRANCWEVKNCQKTECKAYQNIEQQCWYIDGTPCEGYEPRFPQKLEGCRRCEVYLAHSGDEVQQLADAFRHMIVALRDSREDLVRSSDFQQRLIRNSFNGLCELM